MRISVRLIGGFRIDRFDEMVIDVPTGTKALEIIQQLGIPENILGVALINGLHVHKDETLKAGDTLTLLPILGGG